ncbi:MAG: SIS domain-containing protein, partial [Flavobacteriia bacterium]|nr:SIS domain-containing protein [Flavobacteriia bacterium]
MVSSPSPHVGLLPSISEGDLLIIASGSGETESMKVLAKKAKDKKVKLIAFTCDEKSSIGSMADMTVKIHGNSSLDGASESIQPMK